MLAIFLLNLNSIFWWCNSSICQRFLWETMDNYSGHELFTENFITTITGQYSWERYVMCEWKNDLYNVLSYSLPWIIWGLFFYQQVLTSVYLPSRCRRVEGWTKCVVRNRGVTNASYYVFLFVKRTRGYFHNFCSVWIVFYYNN